MKKVLVWVQIVVVFILLAALAHRGWMGKHMVIKIENRFQASEQVTFSCPPGEIYLINVTRGQSHDLRILSTTQNLWCLFARKLDTNYWDCKGVIELQLTCRTGPVDCDSHDPIESLIFDELGVYVNNRLHSKWLPRFEKGRKAGSKKPSRKSID